MRQIAPLQNPGQMILATTMQQHQHLALWIKITAASGDVNLVTIYHMFHCCLAFHHASGGFKAQLKISDDIAHIL